MNASTALSAMVVGGAYRRELLGSGVVDRADAVLLRRLRPVRRGADGLRERLHGRRVLVARIDDGIETFGVASTLPPAWFTSWGSGGCGAGYVVDGAPLSTAGVTGAAGAAGPGMSVRAAVGAGAGGGSLRARRGRATRGCGDQERRASEQADGASESWKGLLRDGLALL